MSQQINLYSPALVERRDRPTAANAAGLLALMLAMLTAAGLTLTGWDASLAARVQRRETAMATAQQQIDAAVAAGHLQQKNTALDRQLAQARQELAWRTAALRMLDQGTAGRPHGYAGILQALAQQSLPGLWLTEIDIGPDGGMALSGRALDATLVPRYVRRLNAEPVMRGKTFAALDMSGQESGVTFQLRASPEPVP